jgi:predicted transcriptional regulator
MEHEDVKQPVTARIHPDDIGRLTRVSERDERTISWLISKAVSEYLDRLES